MWLGLGFVLFNVLGNDLEDLEVMPFKFADIFRFKVRAHSPIGRQIYTQLSYHAQSNIREMKKYCRELKDEETNCVGGVSNY